MGGCRCSFRDCNNSTEKLPGMSFFHYPYKEPVRFKVWLAYAQKDDFKNLDHKTLRNKVVCSDHFRDEHFMNFQKKKLTRTAIPTLGRYRFNRMLVFDYEKGENPPAEQLPKSTLPHLTPPPGHEMPMWSPEYQLAINGDEESRGDSDIACSNSLRNVKSEDFIVQFIDNNEGRGVSMTPARPKLKKNIKSEDYINILELTEAQSSSQAESSEEDRISIKPMRFSPAKLTLKEIPKPEHCSMESRNVDHLKVQRSKDCQPPEASGPCPITPSPKKKVKVWKKPTKVLNNLSTGIAKDVDVFHIPVTQIIGSSEDLLSLEENKHIQVKETQTQTTPDKKSLPDHDKLLLKQKSEFEAQIIELRKKLEVKNQDLEFHKRKSEEEISELKQKITKMESQSKDSVAKTTSLSKAQLYNGLKKYLCPAMATLVRMEMFGGAEREWKKDEKMASVDLLKLGDGVFNYFRDEWRIHLPAKKDVKEWSENADQFDEEDL